MKEVTSNLAPAGNPGPRLTPEPYCECGCGNRPARRLSFDLIGDRHPAHVDLCPAASIKLMHFLEDELGIGFKDEAFAELRAAA